jgi:hypothetical protein
MNDFGHDGLDDELGSVARRLTENRADATPLELDSIKQRAIAQAASTPTSKLNSRKGTLMRSRLVTLVVTIMLIGGTTAGGVAWSGGGHEKGDNAGESEYHCEQHGEHHGNNGGCDNNGEDNDGDHDGSNDHGSGDGNHGGGDGGGGEGHGHHGQGGGGD